MPSPNKRMWVCTCCQPGALFRDSEDLDPSEEVSSQPNCRALGRLLPEPRPLEAELAINSWHFSLTTMSSGWICHLPW